MKQTDLSKQLTKLVEAKVKESGIRMSKKISSGGFFANSTYDNRTVYSLEDLYRLHGEGFAVDSDMGILLFNSLISA